MPSPGNIAALRLRWSAAAIVATVPRSISSFHLPGRPFAGSAPAEGVLLVLLVAVALGMRVWAIELNGWGNEYYAAAVRSMSASWHNFFYVAFDPAGFISVDKPPLALWVDVASVRAFGFRPASLLLPQAVEGTLAVLVLYAIVRRHHGVFAGLMAGFFLALSPVNVAADRSSNTDSLLVLVLLLAAWLLLRAAETGRRSTLLLAFALVGVAFNVKMFAAYIVVPVFASVYFLTTPEPWLRRGLALLVAGGMTLAVSLPWVLFVEATPADARPFVGSSTRNSALDLAVGYNGISRLGVRAPRAASSTGVDNADGARSTAAASGESSARSRIARLFVRVPIGPLRLGDGHLAAQALWLLPLALVAPVAGVARRVWRRPFAGADCTVLLWTVWLVVYALVYSYAGGIFHFYYMSALAPAVAALAAIGMATLWSWYREGRARGALLPCALLATAAWQFFVHTEALGDVDAAAPTWMREIGWTVVGGAALAAGALGAALALKIWRGRRVLQTGALAVGGCALLVLPIAWALSSVLVPTNGVLPSADLLRLDGTARTTAAARERFVAQLVAFLRANRHGERYLLATSTYQLAAPIIIATGEPVMARGGFHGLDPALTPEKLAALVAAGQVRFATLGDVSAISRRMGSGQVDVVAWIRAHGTLVDPALWRGSGPRAIVLYDLRGAPALVSADAVRPRPD